MPADDIVIKNIECEKCQTIFDTPEGHLYGNCPNCNEYWWLDILWEVGWGPPVEQASMRKLKHVHSYGPSWYSIEFGEDI